MVPAHFARVCRFMSVPAPVCLSAFDAGCLEVCCPPTLLLNDHFCDELRNPL